MADDAWTGPPMEMRRPQNVALTPEEAIAGEPFTLLDLGFLGPVASPIDYMQLEPARQPWQRTDLRDRLFPPPDSRREMSLQRYLTGDEPLQPIPAGGIAAVTVFGNNYQSAVSLPRSTTTSSAFQNKVTLTTAALQGRFRVAWRAVVDNFGNIGEFRLQNVTDGATLGATVVFKTNENENRMPVGGWEEVDFTGSPKTFAVQFRARSPGDTQGIQDARIELWRVS